MPSKESQEEKIEKRKKVFPGIKNYETILVTRSDNVGHNETTYYDLRIFNTDDEENMFPTKKGLTVSAHTMKMIALFVLKDMVNVYSIGDWDEDLQ